MKPKGTSILNPKCLNQRAGTSASLHIHTVWTDQVSGLIKLSVKQLLVSNNSTVPWMEC